MNTYGARPAYGGTGEFVTVEYPACRVLATFPTLEAAQQYALECAEWRDSFPDPHVVRPFFAPEWPEREPPSFESLCAIFDRMLRPETA